MKDIALYATDTMADWEYAHITTELARAEETKPGRFRLRIVGDGTREVRSLGGLPIQPELDLGDLDPATTACLVVPGADTYFSGHERLLETVGRFVAAGAPVAAICGATFALARGGLLDDRRHTSNARVFLEQSGYAGAEHYDDAAAVVTDRGITTGSGVRPVPFSAEVFKGQRPAAPGVRRRVGRALHDRRPRVLRTDGGAARCLRELLRATRSPASCCRRSS